jgi:hypothetical protein
LLHLVQRRQMRLHDISFFHGHSPLPGIISSRRFFWRGAGWPVIARL